MVKLTGKAADQRLEAWWKIAQQPKHPPQQVTHVHAPLKPGPYFTSLPAYQRWLLGGPDAAAESLRLSADPELMHPATAAYIRNARSAHHNGTTSLRIFFVTRSDWQDPRSFAHYLAEVHFAHFDAQTGEDVIMVFREDCATAGLVVRDEDVNQWGSAGIMITSLKADEPSERNFLPRGDSSRTAREAKDYIDAAVLVAIKHGTII